VKGCHQIGYKYGVRLTGAFSCILPIIHIATGCYSLAVYSTLSNNLAFTYAMSIFNSSHGTGVSHHPSPPSGDKCQAKSLEDEKASKALRYDFVKARLRINRSLLPVKYDVPFMMSQSAAAQDLPQVTNEFISHASALRGPKVKLVFEEDDDAVECEFDVFITQSHLAFERVLQETQADLVHRSEGYQSEDKALLKSLLEELSLTGADFLHDTLKRHAHERRFRTASPSINMKMQKSEYIAMVDGFETDASVLGTEGGEGNEGRTTAG